MVTLTSASVVSRKIIRYGIITIVTILLARFTFLSGVNLYERLAPKPPPKPTVKFGKLPEIVFPSREEEVGELKYKLETVTGSLPTFTDQVLVYYMPKPQSSIQALDRARKVAADLGFGGAGRENVETVYVFDKQNEPSNLTMNIVTGVFSISYDLNANPQIFERIPPTETNATSAARNLLERAELLKDLTGNPKQQLLRLDSGRLVNAISPSEANFVKINLYRRDYGNETLKLPSVTSNPDESNVWFLLSGAKDTGGEKVISGEYHYFPIDEEKYATYPIKTAQQAWEDLNNGKAFISKLGDNEAEIIIRRVYLAYYDAGQYTPYYQPVAVFEGDGGFVALVPAITNDFYGE